MGHRGSLQIGFLQLRWINHTVIWQMLKSVYLCVKKKYLSAEKKFKEVTILLALVFQLFDSMRATPCRSSKATLNDTSLAKEQSTVMAAERTR